MKDHELLKLIQQYSYLGIFFWFAIIQLLFPIPQEIALVSIGYLSTHIEINIFLSIVVSSVGIMMSDILLFFLSRSGNKITQTLLSKFSTSWRKNIEVRIDKNANVTFFILLMLPEIRMLAPLIAGATGISFKRYISIDIVANLVLSVVYIFLGKFFYASLQELHGKYHKYSHYIFIAIMVIGALFLFLYVRKKFAEKSE